MRKWLKRLSLYGVHWLVATIVIWAMATLVDFQMTEHN